MQATSYESPCHLIFEKSACNFYVTTHDVDLEVDAVAETGPGINTINPFYLKRTIVDNNEYISCIQDYVNKGWDLAGVIHMENISNSVTSYHTKYSQYNEKLKKRYNVKYRHEKFWSTIKLIFQAPAGEESAGGFL